MISKRVMPSRRRGAMLLEVIISIGLLTMGMAFVGLQVRAGLDMARSADVGIRTLLLTETVMAELQGNRIQINFNNDESNKGDFGVRYPGYTWRIKVDPADVNGLYMITLEVGYNASEVQNQITDPTYEISIEDDGTKIVRTVYSLYPMPADVKMDRDFGITSEDIQGALAAAGNTGSSANGGGGAGSIGDAGGGGAGSASGRGNSGGGGGDSIASLLGGASGGGDLLSMAGDAGLDLSSLEFLFDPNGFDPRSLASLPEEDYQKVSGLLNAILKGGGGMLKELPGLLGGNLGELAGKLSDRRGGRGEGAHGEDMEGGPRPEGPPPDTGGGGRRMGGGEPNRPSLADRPDRGAGQTPSGRNMGGNQRASADTRDRNESRGRGDGQDRTSGRNIDTRNRPPGGRSPADVRDRPTGNRSDRPTRREGVDRRSNNREENSQESNGGRSRNRSDRDQRDR